MSVKRLTLIKNNVNQNIFDYMLIFYVRAISNFKHLWWRYCLPVFWLTGDNCITPTEDKKIKRAIQKQLHLINATVLTLEATHVSFIFRQSSSWRKEGRGSLCNDQIFADFHRFSWMTIHLHLLFQSGWIINNIKKTVKKVKLTMQKSDRARFLNKTPFLVTSAHNGSEIVQNQSFVRISNNWTLFPNLKKKT